MKKTAAYLCFIVVGIILLLSSCSTTYSYDTYNPDNIRLSKGKNVAIATSDDGFYGTDIYFGSGLSVSKIIRQFLREYCGKCDIFSDKEKIQDFTTEEMAQYDYIFVPSIEHWEDRATAWSAIPDRASVSIEIYDNSGILLIETLIESTSARMTMGTTDPSEIFAEAVQPFIASLF